MKLSSPNQWTNPNYVEPDYPDLHPTRLQSLNLWKTLGNLEEARKLQDQELWQQEKAENNRLRKEYTQAVRAAAAELWQQEKAENNRLRKEYTQAVRAAAAANRKAYEEYVLLYERTPDEHKMVCCETCQNDVPAPLYLAYVEYDYDYSGQTIFRRKWVCRSCVDKYEGNYIPHPFA